MSNPSQPTKSLLAPARFNTDKMATTTQLVDLGGLIASYDGNPLTIYGFIRDVDKFLNICGGETPQNFARIISKITGKAREHLSVHPHDGTWKGVKELLIEKCEDPRTVDMIQAGILQMRKHSTYAELLDRLQKELYLIRGKYIHLNPTIEENQLKSLMLVYENMARMTVLEMLPDHVSYLYESTGDLDAFKNMIVRLELHGKLSNKKPMFNHPKPVPGPNTFKNTSPQYTPMYYRTFNTNQSQPPQRPWHQQQQQPHWSHKVPNQQQWHQHFRPQQPTAGPVNRYDTDVTMRSRSTGNTGKGQPINIGKGRVAQELFTQELQENDDVIYDSEGNAYRRIDESEPSVENYDETEEDIKYSDFHEEPPEEKSE